ncbi:DNA-binding GntR family transcriptional regulator [Streptomyces sp. SAI-144]|jgi:DNA-binding GntR family transcriptional regulator|uniref:GntR family transcriptional regulator n=1 Tax=Streptomyces sp. SAI-144 TaxID=2940544 RepID=UPI0024746CEA|nr:GntR family transcriptional regulator [Streptomyces sp. SAI-144]MDH6436758.1 DNA-binding GntR family transcriptional regulator [Streptomyces sp. SAI-144]
MTTQAAEVAAGVSATLVVDQVYEVLANRIFTGELPAGARLRVRDIAEQVGTSVMPVREAVRLLVENGLAVSHPHRGARVREFTVRELIEIYDVRAVLEIEATRLGAPRVADSDLAVMREACDRMFRAVVHEDVHEALEADQDMLRQLYLAGGNEVLVQTVESLWTQCRPYKVIGARAAIQSRDASLWEPQPALIDALEERDLDAAIAITRRSVASARRRLENQIVAH